VLQPVSWVAAAIGVCVAAFYYSMNLRETSKNRKITTSNNMLQTLFKEETLQSCGHLLNCTWTDFENFLSKYDSTVNPDNFAKRSSIFSIYETLGYLLKQGLVDKELIYVTGGNSAIFLWGKYKSVIEGYRKVAYGNDYMSYFEYFASEMWNVKRIRDPTFLRDQTMGLEFEKMFEFQ